MALYNIGNFIRRKREELGITQEELSEGICSVTTLSRLENGEQTPRSSNVKALLQRLGYSGALFFQAAGKEEFDIIELQANLRQAYILHDSDRTNKLLLELKEYESLFSPTDRQFYEIMNVITHNDELPALKVVEMLENALRITHPKYSRERLPKVLTYEEVIALNNIAIFIDNCGDRNTSIDIFYHLKNYYEQHVVDIEEAKRMLPTIIYNLSKVLGLAGRYDECIDICNQGIRFAREARRYVSMPHTLYNLAWALIKRNRPYDVESAKQAAKEAYILSEIFKNRPGFSDRVRKFIKENFGEEPPSF